MTRSIRIIGISLLSLILVLIISAIVAVKVINPNDYKNEIITAVHKATGRELSIDGSISLSFFPWLGVDIKEIQLSNPAGFNNQSFAKVGEVEAKIRLLPLFVGKFELGSIILNNASLNLIKTSAQTNNWSDLQSEAKNTQSSAKTSEPSPDISEKINITNISIRNANLSFSDLSTQQKVTLTHFNFDSSNIGIKKQFPVYASFNLKSQKPKLSMQFKGDADLYLNPAKQLYQIKSLNTNGQLSTRMAKNLSFSTQGNVMVDLNKQAWNLDKFVANLADLVLNITAEGDLSKSTSHGSVLVKNFNARNLLQQLNPGLSFQSSKALTNVGAQFSYTLNANAINVPDLKANIDESNLNGNLNYAYANARSLNFNLELDKINLDQYNTTQVSQASKAPNGKAARSESSGNAILPLAFLVNLEGQGKIQISQLTANQIPIKNFLIKSTAHANNINLNPVSAGLYQGSLNGQVNINLQSKVPSISTTLNLSNLNLNDALSNGKASKLSGTLSLSSKLNTVGNTKSAWLNNLQGSGTLNLNNGIINGIDLNYWISQGVSILNKQPPVLTGNTKQTPFSFMQATYSIYQGVLSNQDLKISSAKFNANGNGSINLPQQSINYKVFASVNGANGSAKNWQIPIIITGSLDNPKVELDMISLTKALLKDQLQQQVNKMNENIKGNLHDVLSKIKF